MSGRSVDGNARAASSSAASASAGVGCWQYAPEILGDLRQGALRKVAEIVGEFDVQAPDQRGNR